MADIVVLSAFSDPEAALVRAAPDAAWFYAGVQAGNYARFRQAFRRRGVPALAEPREFQDHVRRMQRPFLDWLEAVHARYGEDLDHWASNTFRADPYSPHLLIYFSCLAFLRPHVLSGKKLTVVTESPALADAVAELAAAAGRTSEAFGRAGLQARQDWKLARRAAAYLLKTVLFFFQWLRRAAPTAAAPDVVIDTFLHADSFTESHEFRDRYFPGLQENAEAAGLRVARAPVFAVQGPGPTGRLLRHIRKSRTAFLLAEDFLSLGDCLAAAAFPLRQARKLDRDVPGFDGLPVRGLVREAARRELFYWESALALLRHRLPARMAERGLKPQRYIAWDESQVINRCAIRGFRDALPEAVVVGAHLNVPPSAAVGHFPTAEKERHRASAHHYVVPGRIGERMIRLYSQDVPVSVGASLLREGLLKAVRARPAAAARPFTTVAALAHNMEESLRMLRILLPALAAPGAEGRRVVLKAHPDNGRERVAAAVRKAGLDVGGAVWSDQPLAGLLAGADLAVAGFSSAGVEAVCQGVPVIFVANPAGLNLNPLEEVDREMWRDVFDAEEFGEAFHGWALKHPLPEEERRKRGAAIAGDFFSENSEKNLSVYLTAGRR